MKWNKMVWFHLLVLIVLLLLAINQIFNVSVFNGFYYGDSEVMAYIAYILGQGGKLYKDFSIVYGPGRPILLSFINKLFGVSMSLPLLVSYGSLIGSLMLWAIYWSTYKLIEIKNNFWHIFLSLVPLFIYMFLLRAGQDTHLIILLFIGFYGVYQKDNRKIWAIISGIFLGLVGFFRIESGIFALITVLLVNVVNNKKEDNRNYFWASYLLFQLGYLLLILLHGSLPNFFHDVVQMGVLSQPKIMKILIQPVDFPLFEFFMLLNIFAILVALYSKNKAFLLLSGISLLGYANALGRADFDHLYYGIVLLVPNIVVAFYYLVKKWKLIINEKIDLRVLLALIVIIILEIIIVKRQMNFLLLVLLISLCLMKIFLKNKVGLLSILVLLIAGQTMFRSLSLFTFYFKRQFQLPPKISISKTFNNVSNFNYLVKKGNYGGYQLNSKNSESLEEIKKDLKDKTVFVYPSHVTIYHSLGIKSPIRYIYFNNEYTQKMETETIEMLKNKKIEYVLLSYELTKKDAIVPNQTKQIENFIMSNYQKEKEYDFGNDNFILMKRIESAI